MHWIIQQFGEEKGFDTLLNILEKSGIPYTVVKVAPFSQDAPEEEQLYPNVNPEGNCVVFGSITLSKIAKRRNWKPGSFSTKIMIIGFGERNIKISY